MATLLREAESLRRQKRIATRYALRGHNNKLEINIKKLSFGLPTPAIATSVYIKSHKPLLQPLY